MTLSALLIAAAGVVVVEPDPSGVSSTAWSNVASAASEPAASATPTRTSPPAQDGPMGEASLASAAPDAVAITTGAAAITTDDETATADSVALSTLDVLDEGPVVDRAMPAPPTRKMTKRELRRARRDAKPSTERRLKLVATINGNMSPKSIVSGQNGKVFAMNMMYGHSITVLNRRYKRAKVIDDAVDLSKFGFKGHPKKVRGAPVEAAVDPRTKRLYVSNYSMYGPGFGHQGFDLCHESDRIDRSFVYVISTRTLRKTDAIRVGEVPKYLAVTPDGRYLLVGNWCSWDISVVDLKRNKEIRRIDAGVAPRGIAFSPNSKTAYVTLVGEHKVLVIDLRTFKVKREITGVGRRPRHLVMSPEGRYLYITSQGEDRVDRLDGRIYKYDLRKKKVVATSQLMKEPRTTVLAEDGKSIYTVDYHAGDLLKLRSSDLKILQRVRLGYHPIGVTYDDASDKVWVSGYGGSVWVLKDR